MIIVVIIGIIVAIIVVALGIIWALNRVFRTDIQYNILNILAIIVLWVIVFLTLLLPMSIIKGI